MILALNDIAINLAIIVLIGPYRTGNTADDRTNHSACEDADARNQRTDTCTDSTANQCTGCDAPERRVITRRRARIILSFADIAVGIAVLVLVGPD